MDTRFRVVTIPQVLALRCWTPEYSIGLEIVMSLVRREEMKQAVAVARCAENGCVFLRFDSTATDLRTNTCVQGGRDFRVVSSAVTRQVRTVALGQR